MTVPPPPASAQARAETLRGLCGGAVHLPGDPGYDLARAPWNVQAATFPAAVAYPAFADEVADVLRAAAAAGLAVAPQGTGHGAARSQGRLGDAVLLRTAAFGELSIDEDRRIARVGAGVLWGDLVDAAGTVGLAGLHPSSPDVGVVGYSIGGGIGWYARRLGLQCNAITRPRWCSPTGPSSAPPPTRTPSCSGGCAAADALGVVTALEFQLYASTASSRASWPGTGRRSSGCCRAGRPGAPTAPDEATTSFRVLHVPPVPSVPGGAAGPPAGVLDGAVLGPDGRAAEFLAPLRALAPEFDTLARVPAAVTGPAAPRARGPQPRYASSALLTGLPDAAVAAVMETAGPGSGNRLTVAELRQLGGALGRPDPDGGALACLDGRVPGARPRPGGGPGDVAGDA